MATTSQQLFERASRALLGVDLTPGVNASTDIDTDPNAAAGLTDSGAANDPTDFPCSAAQERFWLLDRLEPGNPAYSVAVRWRLEGDIRTPLLQRAWEVIIERHEVMRTIFPEIDGKPLQRVLPRIGLKLTDIDLTRLPEAERQPECDRIGGIEARAPFDLATGPLLRVCLVRLTAQTAVLLVTTHQVVSDGWSIGVMAREMGQIHAALAAGREPELPELEIQYGDYSEWQLEWLRARGTQAETDYWTRQLAGARPFRVWPDLPRPAARTTNGAIASRVLPRELTHLAQNMSAAHGATLFTAALAGLCAMLNRYTGAPELLIGTQVSGRDQLELEPMIGQFVNSLILRSSLADDPTFAALVERLRGTVADALEHRHISIERLLGLLQAEHHSQGAPISINFIFQKTFIEDAAYGELRLIDMPSLPAGAIYDLNFFMVERPDGWRLSCQYNTDQFRPDTAERLVSYFEQALRDGATRPSSKISELRLAAAIDAPPQPLAKLEDRVLRLATGNDVAVQCGNTKLTYRQLEAAARRVAGVLHERGIGPGNTVALAFDRCAEYVVGVFGVLLAGAAWTVFDAAAPSQTVLADSRHAATVAGAIDVNTAPARDTPLEPARGDSPAYIGASGNTSTHRSLANLLTSLRDRPGLSERDVLFSVEPWTSDAASVDILWALTTGARLVLATAEEQTDPSKLARALQRSGATLLQAAPTTLEKLAAGGWRGKILCGGGNPRRTLLEARDPWLLHGAGLWSAVLSVRELGLERLGQFNGLPVGTPIANTRLRVLDAQGQTTLIGAAGELCVEAEGQLTHTGETARVWADGVIERAVPNDAPDTSDDATAPADIEARVANIWCELFERPGIDPQTNFFELGGHSLLAARMLARVEAELGRRITLATLFQAPTIRGLARALATESRPYDFRQLVKLQANGSRLPLIAINNTGVYYLLARNLGADQPMISLQMFDPSLRDQVMPDTLEKLAADYVKLIRRVQPDGPYLLMGWCVAGALTFEIARQLHADQQEIRELFLMDSWVPRYFKRQGVLKRLIGERSLRWQFLRADWRRWRQGRLTWQQFIGKRNRLGVLLRPFTTAAHTSHAAADGQENYDQWLLAVLEKLTSRYEPGSYSGKVTLFRSRGEPTGWLFDPKAGWGQFAENVALHLVSGDHFSMFQEPGVSQIAAAMSATLSGAANAAPGVATAGPPASRSP